MVRGKKNVKFGFLFWIIFILLVLLLAFVNKDNIQSVLAQINEKGLLKKKEPVVESSSEIKIQEEINRIINESDSTQSSNSTVEPSTIKIVGQNIKSKENEQKNNAEDSKKDTKDTELKETEPEIEKPKQEKIESVNVNLYFVTIGDDGKISRISTKQKLPKSDSPMSDTLKLLFSNTGNYKENAKYKNLIPEGTKLLGARVENGIAYINVSEAFEFNKYGIEGYLAQLSQIVYTATEYSTVNSVQFLIEGHKKNFLGAEGVWVGSPLSRESF